MTLLQAPSLLATIHESMHVAAVSADGRRHWAVSSRLNDEVGQRWDLGLLRVQPKAVAEIGEEPQPELAAGLEQAQHHVARHPTLRAYGAAGDLALDCAGSSLSFWQPRLSRPRHCPVPVARSRTTGSSGRPPGA